MVEDREQLFLDEGDWVIPGGEGSSEVGGVSVGYRCDGLEWRGNKGWSLWLMWGGSCDSIDIVGSWWV